MQAPLPYKADFPAQAAGPAGLADSQPVASSQAARQPGNQPASQLVLEAVAASFGSSGLLALEAVAASLEAVAASFGTCVF